MVSEGKPPTAAIAAFAFALLYVGFSLLTQLPILLSRPVPTAQQTAARAGAIVGVVIECVVIAALGFGILKKRVWAAWSLLAIAVIELLLSLLRQDIGNAILPLILLSLALWAATSLRVHPNDERMDSAP